LNCWLGIDTQPKEGETVGSEPENTVPIWIMASISRSKSSMGESPSILSSALSSMTKLADTFNRRLSSSLQMNNYYATKTGVLAQTDQLLLFVKSRLRKPRPSPVIFSYFDESNEAARLSPGHIIILQEILKPTS
jgi:hypothetical protein